MEEESSATSIDQKRPSRWLLITAWVLLVLVVLVGIVIWNANQRQMASKRRQVVAALRLLEREKSFPQVSGVTGPDIERDFACTTEQQGPGFSTETFDHEPYLLVWYELTEQTTKMSNKDRWERFIVAFEEQGWKVDGPHYWGVMFTKQTPAGLAQAQLDVPSKSANPSPTELGKFQLWVSIEGSVC